MGSPLLDWNNPAPGIWTATVKVNGCSVESWAKAMLGKSAKTPNGKGRIVECVPNVENRTVEIRVRIGSDL